MPVNLKNPEAERLLNELADETGETLTQAATNAFQERLARLRQEKTRRQKGLLTSLHDLIAEARSQRTEGPPLKQLTDELWGE